MIAAVATGPPVSKSSLLGFFGPIHDIQICPLFCIHASLCASRAEMPAPTGRRGGPRGPDHLWVSFRSGVGWNALLIALTDISQLHCQGLALLPKGVAPNNEHLKYKCACAFHNTKGCTWFALVYMAKQPQVPSSSRPTAHKDEPWQVFIPEDAPHSGHVQVQVRGPHRQFVAASKDRPEMLSMRPNEICAWLRNSAWCQSSNRSSFQGFLNMPVIRANIPPFSPSCRNQCTDPLLFSSSALHLYTMCSLSLHSLFCSAAGQEVLSALDHSCHCPQPIRAQDRLGLV